MSKRKPSYAICETHLAAAISTEIPEAVARIADEACGFWPDLDPKQVINDVSKTIWHSFFAGEVDWRDLAKAAEQKSKKLNRRVSL